MRVCISVLLVILSVLACKQTPGTTELPDGFVRLADTAPDIVQDMRYATQYNFTGKVVPGYERGACVLSEPAAIALSAVQEDLRPDGLTLKVYDCYRPQMAVDAFVNWADSTDQSMKDVFYPELEKAVLFPQGYIAARSGHSRGSTVDLAIAPIADAGETDRSGAPCVSATGEATPSGQLDFGTAYDCFDTLSHTADTRISAKAAANRQMLVDAMARHGFENYPNEWWHFTFQPEPYPDIFFDFPVR